MALGRVIFISTKNKTIVDAGARFYGFTKVKNGTKSVDFLVACDRNYNTSVDFFASQVYLKGVETTIFVLSPTTGPVAFPKTMTGLLTNITGASVGTVATLTLGFDGPTTQAANTAGQSSLQASQNIRGTYTAKGYTDLNPGVP